MAKKAQSRKPKGGDTTGDDVAMHDRDIVFRQHFDGRQTQFLQTLVCDDVIDEHKRKPLGQHSEPLERLLHHFRRMAMTNKYAVRRNSATSRFSIVAFSGTRGTPPSAVEDTDYETVEEAYHGVFLLQIKDLMGA